MIEDFSIMSLYHLPVTDFSLLPVLHHPDQLDIHVTTFAWKDALVTGHEMLKRPPGAHG